MKPELLNFEEIKNIAESIIDIDKVDIICSHLVNYIINNNDNVYILDDDIILYKHFNKFSNILCYINRYLSNSYNNLQKQEQEILENKKKYNVSILLKFKPLKNLAKLIYNQFTNDKNCF